METMPCHTLRLRAATDITQAASILRGGGTVAFPTETVYGLGANALDLGALAKIFAAKQRPTWDPLIVHVADIAMLESLVTLIPKPARLWLQRFSPGPLTVLLPRGPSIPDAVTAGRSLVGIRIPAHPVAQALLRAAGTPIAAPSANLFGHVSPTTAVHVLTDLDGRIDAVLDGGPCEHGLESTVVDACASPCVVYRPGAITLQQLKEVWPAVETYRATESSTPAEALPSPGVGLRHYAPRARLILIPSISDQHGTGNAEELILSQGEQLLRAVHAGTGHTALMLPEGLLSPALAAQIPVAVTIFPWGRWSALEELAHRLFEGLRTLDASGAECILCPMPSEQGIGAALCDRLRKAARPR